MDRLCFHCHKNQAIVFFHKPGEGTTRGLCLECASKANLPEVDREIKAMGLDPEQLEGIQQMANTIGSKINNDSFAELLEHASTPQALAEYIEQNPHIAQEFTEVLEDPEVADAMVDNPLVKSFNGESFFAEAALGAEDAEADLESEDSNADAETENSESEATSKSSDAPHSDKEKSFEPFNPFRGYNLFGSKGKADQAGEQQKGQGKDRKRATKNSNLQKFTVNLNRKAARGEIDRLIGREQELNRTIQILNRRQKNNAALIGEPGVGKTAIAEGLSVRINEGNVPAKLIDKQIHLLNMTAMVAGTQFRGQFEARMQGLIDEIIKEKNVILVIDEMQNLMSAGDADGAMNAANILKPALAKGDIQVIGSTTYEEYRKFIEKDTALSRRFQTVQIEEPSLAEAIEILHGVRDYYEKHHYVHYSEAALKAAVHLSSRYMSERFLPDKAIDLIDEAGSKVNLNNKALIELRQVEQRLAEIKKEREQNLVLLEKTEDEKEKLEYYEKDATLKTEELREQNAYENYQKICQPIEITEQEIAQVVELWTGIPVKDLTETETQKLINLEERLHRRVIGQSKAVDALATAVRRKRAGFGRKNKPASFLFVGPTGVGKTELVKALAATLFDSEDALVRLDMSEYMEAHTVSKLIGSPPGYVGYDDGGQLTEKIRRHPYSVILLDEIEKAHAEVYNILLQILDDGRLTDSHGRKVNFANTVIVMTSNAGTSIQANGMGFGADGYSALESRVNDALKQQFRPEFLNRIDEVIVFNELSQQELREIVDLMLQEVRENASAHGVKIELTEQAKERLTHEGYDPKYGARPLRKVIQRRIEDLLSDLLLQGKLAEITKLTIDYDATEDQFITDL